MDITMMDLDITGIPPTINHAYGRRRGGGVYLKKPGVDFKKHVAEQYYDQFTLPRGVTYAFPKPLRLKVQIWIYFATRRKCDLDNRLKILLDAFEFACILEDDSQIDDLRIVRYYANEPSTDVTIEVIPQ